MVWKVIRGQLSIRLGNAWGEKFERYFFQKKWKHEEIHWLGQRQVECVTFKHLLFCVLHSSTHGPRHIETLPALPYAWGPTLWSPSSCVYPWAEASLGLLRCVHSEPMHHLADHGTCSCALEFCTQMAPNLCPQPAWVLSRVDYIPLLWVPPGSSVGQGEVVRGDFGQIC